jgi:hypothetical protein
MRETIFKTTLLVATVLFFIGMVQKANASDATFHLGYPGQKISKADAIRELAISRNEKVVVKCQAVKLDEDKGTIKTR